MQDQSRRAFLKRAAILGLAGAATPLVTTLGAIGEAAAATASDYKALVCVFLAGGNDATNTLTPYDQASYNQYYNARSAIALSRSALAGTVLNPSVALPDGQQYALAPTMASLVPLFDAGKLAIALNVGTLVQPTTKAQYLAKSVMLPPKLFSHNDQSSYFQASHPEGATSGWGGRMGDLFQSGNGAATLTCINANSNAVFLAGQQAVQYSVGPGGPVPLLGNANAMFGSPAGAATLRQLMTSQSAHMMADDYTVVTKRSLDTYAQVASALAGAPNSGFTLFPSGNSLADQLKMVARMIAVAQALNARRQIFFVSLGGFDLHDGLATSHPALIGKVADAMRAFYDTTVNLGVANQVTTFTASDFGRTLQCNSDGSDHGWGAAHFVMGGAVNGKRYYGTPPAIGNDTVDDVGAGRLLPTMAVDQYASTLASWFGVSASDMPTVLPNIGNYDASSRLVGFV